MLQNIFFRIKKILIDTHTKIWTEITDIIFFRKKLLKFLQGVMVVSENFFSVVVSTENPHYS